MFQSANGSQGQDLAVMPAAGDVTGPTDIAMNSAPAMQNFQAPPLNAASPFGAASALFKTVPGESLHAAAVQSSPFSPQGAAPAQAPLTVGDVLPQLPPDLVRMNGLSPEQPVAVSAQVLDAALRSGQAALPIFEIYRVCPALFQTAISPQDPRMVPLPAAKLPRLIASAQQAAAGPAGGSAATSSFAASPFGSAQPAANPAPSPFSAQAPASAATALPPRRNGPPPPLADIPREAPGSLNLPGGGGQAPAFPTSPFSAAAGPSSGSPFGTPQAEPGSPPQGPGAAHPQAGMFAAASPAPAPAPAAAPQASPFGGAGFGGPAETPASPFAAFPPPAAAAPAPAPGATPASPFASLFGNKAVPTGQPAPDAPVRSAAPPVQAANSAPPSLSPPPAPGQMNGPNLRISLASLLRGYSVAELGFDPVMVPTWIMTSQPAAVVREWAQSPAPLAELGSLIDGITDVGFRNVLNHAKRDFQVRIPHAEIHAAMAGGAPPTLPNLSSLGQPPASQPPAQVVMTTPMAPPASQQGAPLFASSLPPEQEAGSPFSTQSPAPQAQAPVQSSPASLFSSAAPPQSPPTPQHAPASPFPAAPPSHSQPPMAAFPSAPAPLSNPFAFPASSPPPAPVAARPAENPPSPFSEPPSPPSRQAPPQYQAAPPMEAAPPPASFPQPPEDGFSSAELMGVRPSENTSSRIPPAPSIPVTNPFTGKEATHVVDVQEEPEPPPPPSPAPSRQAAEPQAFTPRPVPKPAPASPPPPPSRSGSSSPPALGIKPHNSDPDQILLRALLCTDDDLTPQRIVEMVCTLPGIAACVCLHGDQAISHVGAHKPQAREFQKQATGLAHHLRTLAPLIGIENAETFTLTSGDRLMTFCFPDEAILGILHDAEPSLGLRDKITLIARELSRMLG